MPTSDHDSLVTLIESVKNIKDWQDKFHSEMKVTMDELKNNYTGKLHAHEQRIFRLETSKTKQTVLLSVGIGILSILSSLMIYHMFK
jgi:hypothetical protein